MVSMVRRHGSPERAKVGGWKWQVNSLYWDTETDLHLPSFANYLTRVCPLSCVSAPPSSWCLVWNARSMVNMGSTAWGSKQKQNLLKRDVSRIDFKDIINTRLRPHFPLKAFRQFLFPCTMSISTSPDCGMCTPENEAIFMVDWSLGDKTDNTNEGSRISTYLKERIREETQ